MRQQIQQVYNSNLRNYNITQRCERLLLTMLEQAVKSTYLAGIYSETQGFRNRNVQDVFTYLFQTYGRISTNAIRANTQKLTQPVAPHLPVAIIFRQIEDCQRFATAAGAPFTPAQILKAAEMFILSTGRYIISYREWIGLPDAAKTYNNFKIRFAREYQLQNEMKEVTTGDAGYANNMEFPIMEENENREDLREVMQNFANTTTADREAFQQLTRSNAMLEEQLSNMYQQNINLAQQISTRNNLPQVSQPKIIPPPTT